MKDPIARIEYDLIESPEWVGDEADDTRAAMAEDARCHFGEQRYDRENDK